MMTEHLIAKRLKFAQVCDAFILNGIAYCFEKG